jgi:ADP-dependent NAD(P)H-hydrate dehydratase / NAD(P)H-hydrate epimerase
MKPVTHTAAEPAPWLPEALFRAAQVREFDRRAIDGYAIASNVLMERAGAAAFGLATVRWPRARRVVVVCGTGNNGGDGFVVARLAKLAGLATIVLLVGDEAGIRGDAAIMRRRCVDAGVEIAAFHADRLRDAGLVIDALLGTGLQRIVEGPWREAIATINSITAPKLAVDVPSGLNSDSGAVMGAAVRAEATMSFIGLKTGLFTGSGRTHAGTIYFDDLGVPPDVYAGVEPAAHRILETGVSGLLRRRARDAHKGTCGHVLVIGGNAGMSGAVRLAGEAAYRAGAGLVTIATHPDHAAAVNATRPELIVVGARAAKDLAEPLARADVVALGPGLGGDRWARTIYRAICRSELPLVVDADALNLLSDAPACRSNWVLTPHPGEAGRLLGTTTRAVQQDRFAAARSIVARYGGVCVLKGSGTIVAEHADASTDLCDRGNPGMASGGMGDVLTGILAALRAQGLAARDAARLGVWLHASAADAAAVEEGGETGLLASDLMPRLRALIAGIAG